ncbi:LysR family transcriptional regulator [Thalassomonas viridans]|uniref:LysR family transcriptional regulator n=1 Tax=Thalassomonas viridans TaxID=137584 RepID=A0AAE9Z880_9GAMM|nr:LysR family transcriptional regulator [Thalassomonas viridans]WDE07088.1 LysR family transcriptional regulator [Thalassomonas viridans]
MSKINRLEIKQLRIFQALLHERNVSRVASQVGLTQQAVSDQLRKLRDIFDDRLFLRKSNGLIPTPVAEALGVKIAALLAGFEGLLDPDTFDPATVDATYVIAATDYAQQVVLPALLAKIRHFAPGLKIIIRDFDIDNLHELMVNSRVNLAIAFPDYIPASYPYLTLFTEHHVCVAGEQSHLSGRELSLQDIAHEAQIIASPSRPNFKGSIDSLFEQAGLTRNVVISAPCFSVVPGYIATTGAIAFLPSRAIQDNRLVQLNLNEKLINFDVIAAWHPRSSQDPLHNWIMGLLKEEYQAG